LKSLHKRIGIHQSIIQVVRICIGMYLAFFESNSEAINNVCSSDISRSDASANRHYHAFNYHMRLNCSGAVGGLRMQSGMEWHFLALVAFFGIDGILWPRVASGGIGWHWVASAGIGWHRLAFDATRCRPGSLVWHRCQATNYWEKGTPR
jgi:hypothetical protein